LRLGDEVIRRGRAHVASARPDERSAPHDHDHPLRDARPPCALARHGQL